MIREQRAIMDPVGLIAESLEWCARLFCNSMVIFSSVSSDHASLSSFFFFLTPRRYTSYYLAAKETPRGKVLTKEDARAIVDGSFFPAVAADLEAGRLERRSLFKAGLYPKAPAAGKAGKAGAAGGKAGELRKEL